MHLDFDEEFPVSIENVYRYVQTPQAWPELWSAFTKVTGPVDGWHRVWVRRTPFPLVVKITSDEPLRRVSWDLRGFWKGHGELRFEAAEAGTRILGYETITLPVIARPLEGILNPRFAAVWEGGWRRLRRGDQNRV